MLKFYLSKPLSTKKNIPTVILTYLRLRIGPCMDNLILK
jgi:hypothetical protein